MTAGARLGGRYELVESLGEGTYGEVWRGVDTTFDDRAVAVKILKPQYLDDPGVVARFEGEAAALAKLSHPNVVAIFDRGESQGVLYIVMELVTGQSLEMWLDEHERAGRLPDVATAIDLFDQICAGVEAAHDVRAPQAIVHRDLKPGNVMLATGKNQSLVAKVLDFGVARLGSRKNTTSGGVIGTPLYMSPEQAMGQASQVGPWSDVFSLGAMLVELLTLRQMLEEDRPWWAAIAVYRIDAGAGLRGLRSDVPPSLWDVAAKALSLEPTARHEDAGRLRAAVKAAMAGAAQSASNPIPASRIAVRPLRSREKPSSLAATAPAKTTPSWRWSLAAMIPAALALAGWRLSKTTTPVITASEAASSSIAESSSIAASSASPVSTKTDAECAGGGMVDVRAGTFTMGDRNGRKVTMSAFSIDRTDVTVAAYRKCFDADPASCPLPSPYRNCNWNVAGRECHPINCVPWAAADAYCRRAGGHLPTEAQWEYAARGTDGRTYPWGNDAPKNQLCWDGEGNDLGFGNRQSTCVAGSFPAGASPFGVLDMLGNVSEWIDDWYAPYDLTATRDPHRTKEQRDAPWRVVRGGTGWDARWPELVDTTARGMYVVTFSDEKLGFRCARGPNP